MHDGRQDPGRGEWSTVSYDEPCKATLSHLTFQDTALWIMEGIQQSALTEHFPSDESRALKVVFERCINWMRCGALPIFIIEHKHPAAKRG